MANSKEAKARIKINKLLEQAGWRFFDNEKGEGNINVRFYYYLSSQEKDNLFTNLMYGTSNVSFLIEDCFDIEVPLSTKEEQNLIIDRIDNELKLISANSKLVDLFNEKIDTKIDEVRG